MAKQVTARSTVVAFANNKGGVSKSSMAANLGAHLAGAGDSVTLIDAHPQGSLSRWHELRQMFDPSGNPQLYPATQETLRVKVDKARKAGARWIIIDTALREFDEVVPPSIRVADFVVVPARPSPVDIEASRAAFEAIERAATPYCVLLTAYDPTWALSKSAKRLIERMRPGKLLTATMGYSAAYVGTMASGATGPEYNSNAAAAKAAAKHITAICTEIKRRIEVGK